MKNQVYLNTIFALFFLLNFNSEFPSFYAISILVGVLTLGLFWTTDIDAEPLLPPKSNLDLFLDSDVVLMGNILSKSSESDETTYEIRVDRYLKNSLDDNIIHATTVGTTNSAIMSTENIFELDENVFLYLIWSNDKYVISPYSVAFFENFTEFLIPPPLKLFKHGLDSSEIPCKSFHEKIIKPSGNPICVKPSTAEILKDRGWGVTI